MNSFKVRSIVLSGKSLEHNNIRPVFNGSGLAYLHELDALGADTLGNPTDGSYGGVNGAIAGVASGDKHEDAFDKIETILGKLAPSRPENLSLKTLSFLNTTYTAKEVGTDISRNTVVVNADITGRVTGFYNADAGTLAAYYDGGGVGSRVLSTASDIGTYTNLFITQDADFWSGSVGKEGFWKYLNADIRMTSTTTGVHTLQLTHSETGPSNILTGYRDNVSTPSVSSLTVVTGTVAGGGRFLDGVPYLNTNDQVIINYTISNAVSNFYNPTRIGRVECTQFTALDVAPTGAFVNGQNYVCTATRTINTNNYDSDGISVTARGYNAIDANGSSTLNTAIIVNSKTDSMAASRVKAGAGQYPSLGAYPGYGDPYNNNELLTSNEELQFLDQEYDYPPATNYSSYIPVGPNYSAIAGGSYSNMRWACFNLGAITSASAITLTFNNSSNFSSVVLTNFALYVRVNGSLPTAGWIDGNVAYPGVGDPTNNGDAALVIASSTSTAKRITFGSSVKTGDVIVRIGIPAGDTKEFRSVTISL